MITVEPTADLELIADIARHPALWEHIGDDSRPPREDFRIPPHAGALHLVVRDGAELLGAFSFIQQSDCACEIHTCLLPRAWGGRARQAAALAVRWIWEHTRMERIVTTIPASNRLAIAYAKRGGMTQYGRNERAWRKGGELQDTVLLGMSRPKE